jgi:hypothetical protein
MTFRRRDDDDDGLNIVSGDDQDADDGQEGESGDLFEEGQACDRCGRAPGRVGLDPTCRGQYEGQPELACYDCAADALREAWSSVEGMAVVVQPFGEYSAHYYYRLDEMPAYRFVRDDIEAISWLFLTIGDDCARCGQQSRVAWLTRDNVDPSLPEDRPLFRRLDDGGEHLCASCTAAALADAYASLKLPLMTVEVPRSAMGVLMPTGE